MLVVRAVGHGKGHRMAQRRPTRQELLRRQRRGSFIGRGEQLAAFRENLARDPFEGASLFRHLWHVHGQSGVGKTALVQQWRQQAEERDQAVTAVVEDDVHDAVEAMESIAGSLRQQGAELREFEKKLEEYRKHRHEAARAVVAEPETAEGAPVVSAGSAVAARGALMGLGAVPGIGGLAGVLDPERMAMGLDRVRMALSARLGGVENVQLVMSPLKVLTPLFLKDLAKVADARELVVLFFDVYERTGPVLDAWLREITCKDGYGELAANVIVVLAGQGRLNPQCWGDWTEVLTEVPLEVFTETEARDLLARRGVRDESVVEVILRLSGRLPVLVDMLAQPHPTAPGEIIDPSETAVDRFLRWIGDPARRAAALACALPLQLDEDIYHAAVPGETADSYAWLRTLPFIRQHHGQVRYHDTVRALMLRHQRTHTQGQWRERHTRLADHHQQRRDVIEEAALDGDLDHWHDGEWRAHRLAETYHRLCANPRHALTAALVETIHACDHGLPTLRRWAQTLHQASQDTNDPALSHWGRRLAEAADTGADSSLPALEHLITVPGLDTTSQALAHALLGYEHHNAGNRQNALDAFTHALALDPEAELALTGRGVTHSLMGDHERAFADFNLAHDLDPDNAQVLTLRGTVHQVMGDHERAFADFNLAHDLDPNSAQVLTQRGITHRGMGDYERALADLNLAHGLDPDNARVLTQRARIHREMSNHERALADLNLAHDLDPDNARILTQRARIHREMSNHERALADLNLAHDLDPDDAWILTQRGMIHRDMGDHERALADFNLAYDLDPNNAQVLTLRGITHEEMSNHVQAFADFNLAHNLDPNNAQVLTLRGIAHREMSNHVQAFADFNLAHDLDPNDAQVLTQRGITHEEMGDHERALADLNLAHDLDPDNARVLTQRARIHREMSNRERALADLNLAHDLDPDDAWILTQRGMIHRDMGDHERALADFNLAYDLDPDDAQVLTQRGIAHREMGDYERALADLNLAHDLDPDNAWILHELALLCRLMGREEEHECWRQAIALLTSQGTGTGPDAAHARGNLIVVACATADWDQALAAVEQFLRQEPTWRRVKGTLNDLSSLAEALQVDAARLQSVRGRLETALNLSLNV
ncbi:tetratricopeptide repeat protein [Streptomyces sp. NPDC004134]|uniref:tetratricopeptide repeat protein n=1 Tax=Streptomyces sp. NPDC004134 TaxID=3364691 RepID=UPI00369CD867